MNVIVSILLAKLKEPSTWRGLSVIAAAVGINLSPELWQSIAAAGAAAVGLVEVVRKEKN